MTYAKTHQSIAKLNVMHGNSSTEIAPMLGSEPRPKAVSESIFPHVDSSYAKFDVLAKCR
jgi:hypothetical protein